MNLPITMFWRRDQHDAEDVLSAFMESMNALTEILRPGDSMSILVRVPHTSPKERR